jgi:AraC-like DNA-binding protein
MKNIYYEYYHDKDSAFKVHLGKNTNTQPHFHKCIEILYLVSGSMESTVADMTRETKSDQIVFVHNYYIHAFKPIEEYKKYFFIIPVNFSTDLDKKMKNATLAPILDDRNFNRENILPIFKKMYEERNTMPTLVKKGYLNVIMGLLFQHYESIPIQTPSNIEFMVDVLQYIDKNYMQNLTLDSVSQHFGYNKYYFSRLFNRYIGENLSNYINMVRLQNFTRLAKEQENPQVSKLAMDCGFDSLPTFYRAFSRLYKTSPKEIFSKK